MWYVQVRKSYEEKRRKRTGQGQGRAWKLKRMNIDVDDGMVLKKGQQQQADKRQQDLERFMQVGQHQLVVLNLNESVICMCSLHLHIVYTEGDQALR